jgi:hypothetical protein
VRRAHFALLALLAPLVACGADTAAPAPSSSRTTLADLVTVNQVAIYQGVKVTLVDNETIDANPNAPVVPSRPAYVRVHPRRRLAAPGAAPAAVGPLVARLTVRAAGMPDVVLSDGPKRLAVLDDAVVASTFNFELKADQVRIGATYAVDLVDPSGAWDGAAHFPATDEATSLGVGPLAPTLRVRFVPVRYQADGSSRLSPLDEGTIEAYREALYKLYPASNVEITVRRELAWPSTLAPNGEGWDQLLSAIIETRSDDDVADDVYYVGIFNPAATEHEYCARGCILGVAPAAYRGEVDLRVAMVVGYPSERAHGTLAQELAHAMGRYHAPCGSPNAVDAKFPYADGGIGTWGYDVVERKLVNPSRHVFDFMSYCSPIWVSDYTFAGLYRNMVGVNATKRSPTLSQSRIKSYRVTSDGTLVPGPTMRIPSDASPPELREDIAGRPLRGRFFATPELGGGYWLPEAAIPEGTRLTLAPPAN